MPLHHVSAQDPVFGAALVDNGARHRILGVRVQPFCLWHLYLLQLLDSPFIRNVKPTRFELKTAVAICRLGYRKSALHRPVMPILTKKRFEYSLGRFYQYVGDYLHKPEYNIVSLEGPGGKPPPRLNHPPEAVRTAYEAAWGANCSIKEAWELPIGEAYIAQSMYLRHQGCLLDFMLEDERKFQRELIAAGVR